MWCSQAIRKAERRTGNDLVGYMDASRALYAGGDPYHLPDRFPYIYPLFLATVIRPLAALPVAAASVIWFAIQASCLWYVFSLVTRSVAEDHSTAFPRIDLPVMAAIVVAVFGDVLQSEVLNGQVNLIVLALALAAIHFGHRPLVSAPLLGAAIALKLTPAVFLLYWAVARRYRLVIESVIWAGALMLLPWLVAGRRLWPMYDSYIREFILARATSASSQTHAIFLTPYGFWGWLTGTTPGRALILASSIGVVLALITWHARIRSRVQERALPWLYAAAIPLLSPMSEVHHLTMLIPAAVSAVSAWRRESRALPAAAAVFVVLIWVGRFDRPGPWYFLSVVCLIATAVICLRAADPSGTGPLNSGASGASAGRRWGWGPTAN